MDGKSKTAVITELIDLLAANGLVSDKKLACEAVFNREKTRSTGIGSGIAIPHGKCKAVKELVMAVGVTAEPVDFDSVDDKPVKIVILLISPPDQTGPHIQALARISRLLLDEPFKHAFERAANAEEAYDLVNRKESQ